MMLRQEGNPELSATRGPAQEAEKIPRDGRGLAPAGAAAVPGFTGPAGLGNAKCCRVKRSAFEVSAFISRCFPKQK